MAVATSQPSNYFGLSTDPLAVNVEGVYLPSAGKKNCITNATLTETGTVTVGTASGVYWEFSNSALQDSAMSDFGAGPLTLVVLFESTSSTAAQYCLAVSNPSTDHWHGISYEGNNGPQLVSRGSAATSAQLASSTRFTNSLLAGSVRSATEREIYDDGGSSVTNTTSVTMSGAVTTVVIGGLLRGGTIVNRVLDAGRIRVAYVIRGSLSDSDHASLGANPWRLLDDGVASNIALDATVSMRGAVSASLTTAIPLQATVSMRTAVSALMVPYTIIDTTEPVANQPTTILVPSSPASPACCVIYCHGRGESQQNIYNQADIKKATVDAITGAGIYMASSLATAAGVGANSWGNAGAVEAVVQLMRYMRATYSVSRFVLWGDSMGGVLALNVIASGRERVLGFLGHAPVCNLADMRARAYGSEIDTAYGVATSPATFANKTYGYDPVLRHAFAHQHIPTLMAASASDTTVSKANNADTFAALLAGTVRSVTVATATGGHIDNSHFDATRDLAFVQGCFSTPVALGRPASNRTVNVVLKDSAGSPRANLTGLRVAWFDQPLASGLAYPTARYTGATTDASGVLSITSVPSDLSVGGVGLMLVTDSDGTTTQTPVHKVAGGPIAVS